jgi:hypothetical protein
MNDKIGRFGLLTCNLIDPLSILMDKISISYNNEYNSVGLYYINDGDYNILLFDLYDSYHIKWTISHCTLSHFISSLYTMKINFYSFDDDNPKNFPSIYNTDILKCNNNYNHKRSKLEEKFINIISGLLISCNYERNYDNYLLNIVNNNKRGDELINKILLLLFDNYNTSKHFTESIKNNLTFKTTTNYINIIDHNFEDIMNNEILKFKECFFKIYTNHSIFDNIDLSIFIPETESIKKSILNNDKFLIKDIKNLGYWLNQIIISNNKLEQILAVKNTITIYNNLIINTDIQSININKNFTIILNPDTICYENDFEQIVSIIRSNIITQNKTDLSILSYKQLFDILIYIDSLRDSSGFADNRFSGVQNLITKELSHRTK